MGAASDGGGGGGGARKESAEGRVSSTPLAPLSLID